MTGRTPEPARTTGSQTPGVVPTKESSLTLERGLNLLQAVADADSEAPTISDLATAVGVSRAAVYRLLGPLQNRGLIRREGSKVRLGLGVLWLAGRVLAAHQLPAPAGAPVTYDWQAIWNMPAWGAVVVLALFALFFRNPVKNVPLEQDDGGPRNEDGGRTEGRGRERGKGKGERGRARGILGGCG